MVITGQRSYSYFFCLFNMPISVMTFCFRNHASLMVTLKETSDTDVESTNYRCRIKYSHLIETCSAKMFKLNPVEVVHVSHIWLRGSMMTVCHQGLGLSWSKCMCTKNVSRLSFLTIKTLPKMYHGLFYQEFHFDGFIGSS